MTVATAVSDKPAERPEPPATSRVMSFRRSRQTSATMSTTATGRKNAPITVDEMTGGAAGGAAAASASSPGPALGEGVVADAVGVSTGLGVSEPAQHSDAAPVRLLE